MGVFNKIKNFFVEEVEEDEEEEEEVREPEQQYARKVEVPKKSFKERFRLREKLEEEDEDEEEEHEEKVELEEQEPNVYIPKNNNISFEEDEIKPEPKEEVTFEEEEEVELPSRSSRTPLVFEDDNLFQEEDDYKPVIEEEEEEQEVEMEEEEEEEPEVTPPPKEKYRPPLLYQGRKESNYIDSINKENYYKQGNNQDKGEKKFKPSPIISPIYGILDKNYKKEEIRSKSDYKRNMEKEDKENPIDTVRKKAYGEERRTTREEVKEERPIKSEKKVNLTHDVPTVSDVTIAEADDYYNELGFVYNVNYKNESRNQPSKKKVEKKETEINDNLFDLVDSMHDKKED